MRTAVCSGRSPLPVLVSNDRCRAAAATAARPGPAALSAAGLLLMSPGDDGRGAENGVPPGRVAPFVHHAGRGGSIKTCISPAALMPISSANPVGAGGAVSAAAVGVRANGGAQAG
eukprot:CAMPEP_0206144652 /NCGR_PEP_ID=MMETSP1473-20131121/24756_1 /ASSEMBLY_ACC=CAM_ASM_001109 /TAXON_ID=1461547 /ORGANISM="Stichococcus sp, Strain RCC1054" /LENGTH=115 /DNA_ID=CAMNT_0053540527 /DNA_START=133 /DNA_END=480 /DNA_ORIENTATION=-